MTNHGRVVGDANQIHGSGLIKGERSNNKT